MEIKIDDAEKQFKNVIITDQDYLGEKIGYLWLGCDGHCFGTIEKIKDLKKIRDACIELIGKDREPK